ncbi:MAG: hypothetical protein ACYDA3_14270 [Gaiellaceae bacterium]
MTSRQRLTRLAVLVAAVFALVVPTIAVADKPPPKTPPGQTTTPAKPTVPPGQAKKGAPSKDTPGAPQNRGNGDTANGCTGSVKTTVADGSVVNANKYQIGDAVYVSGSNFPTGAVFTFQVVHVQTKTVVASGSFTGSAGSFLQQIAQDPKLTGHEYKVIVYYNTASGHRCHKSDNFFFVGGTDVKGAEQVVVCAATGSEKHPYHELKLPAAAIQHRHKKAGDITPAPEGGCPTTADVKAAEQAKAPLQTNVGQQVTIHVTAVPNTTVTVKGAGVDQSVTTTTAGIATVTIKPTKPGIVAVKGASSKPLAMFGVLGARSSGLAFTG